VKDFLPWTDDKCQNRTDIGICFFISHLRVVGDNLWSGGVGDELPLGRHQTLNTNGTSRVDPVGADANFGSETEPEAVGKASAAVTEDASTVHRIEELLSNGVIFR